MPEHFLNLFHLFGVFDDLLILEVVEPVSDALTYLFSALLLLRQLLHHPLLVRSTLDDLDVN